MEYKYLDNIDSPAELRAVPARDIPELCTEIRRFLLENIEQTGGHLASNLGVTELTVAIHRVFDSPRDHIIFDVGHQSYVHKIITGRKNEFKNLRKTGGLSGFTSRKESEHDPFGAGHSSTSISAAIGFAEADMLAGRKDYTIAVVGDGAFTGGMIHEALNNCNPNSRLIIILNENGMSISVNKGRIARYLSKARMSKGYRGLKRFTKALFGVIPLLGKPMISLLDFIKQKIKNTVFSSNYFEDLGLYYMGAIDGNNYKKVESALEQAKELGKCVIVHVRTTKGKGYLPAEENPDNFHSVASSSASSGRTFHEAFSDKLLDMSERDDKITAVTAAMGIGTGLEAFGERYPERYFDVGIAEEHALTFSAGLAASGMKPYVAIYSTFLQRGYDNLIHDIALQDLPVRLIVDRASLSVGDGATHHGIFDCGFLMQIPNFTVYSPVTYKSLESVLELSRTFPSPIAIRYPNAPECKAAAELFYSDGDYSEIGIRATDGIENTKYVFVSYGSIIPKVIEARELLFSEGIDTGIVLIERLKPYGDIAEKLARIIANAEKVVFAEEGIKCGGAGMIFREELARLGHDFGKCKYEIAAIDDNFASPKEPCELYDYLGLSPEKLAEHFKDYN